MKFKHITGASGTSLQGYVEVTYATLKRVFGAPTCDGDGYKVDAEWLLKFADGTIATIYNYKDGKNYCGAKGTPKTKITNWHIGGNDQRAVYRVQEALEALELA